MPPGADKRISYDPPGAIGLTASNPVFHIRFEETEDAQRPQDTGPVCADFDVHINGLSVMPSVTAAALGRGRAFNGTTTGIGARDIVSGATLLTRDMSIQVALSWDAVTQAANQPGCIVCRGLGTSAAEYVAYSLQLDVVDAPSFLGRLRWHWQDIAGADHTAVGALVVIPPNQFTILTATRRWISPTQVELAYYVGDQLAGAETSTNGSIGGGTTGALEIGFRSQGANGKFYAGIIDELMIVDRELCAEEIEATWLRITVYQPRGTKLLLEMVDPEFPISDDPGSDVQLDFRLQGQALGFAAAQIENLRANFLPGRAYGSTLEQWEEAVRVTPQPAQDIATRRARVEGRLRQRRGVSIPGIGDALAGLLGGASVDDLEYIAFSSTIEDAFTAIDPLRWDVQPPASWTAPSGTARVSPAAGSYVFDGVNKNWLTMATTIGGDGLECQLLSKLVMTTPQNGLEVGVYVNDATANNYILFGLYDNAGVFTLVQSRFESGILTGAISTVLGANPAAIWLRIFQTTTPGTWQTGWSTTSGTTGFTLGAPFSHPTVAHWAGFYARTITPIGAAAQANLDDLVLRAPFSGRPFNAYVLLDKALGFTPDSIACRSVIEAIKHGFIHATFITEPVFLAGDLESGAGLGPTGGY